MVKKDLELQRKWASLRSLLLNHIGKRPKNLDEILFLIGIQELGAGPRNFSKEEKQDLIHIAICRILAASDYYQLDGLDQEGWPHWKKIRDIPRMDAIEQETFLKLHAIQYFEEELDLTF